jgi:hypothetical protein
MNDWRVQAHCRGEEPTWWDTYPATDEGGQWKNRAAIAVCRTCPVQRQCVQEAAAYRDDGVIRGGWKFTGQLVDARRCWRCGRWFVAKKASARRFCREACSARAVV